MPFQRRVSDRDAGRCRSCSASAAGIPIPRSEAHRTAPCTAGRLPRCESTACREWLWLQFPVAKVAELRVSVPLKKSIGHAVYASAIETFLLCKSQRLCFVSRTRLTRRSAGSGSAQILYEPRTLMSQIIGSMKRPVGIAQKFTRHQDQVCLPCAQNVVRLRRIGDHPHGAREDSCLPANLLGKMRLVSRTDRDLHAGHKAAGRDIHQIDSAQAQLSGESNGFLYVPAAIGPVCGGNAHEKRLLIRPPLEHGIDHTHQGTAPVLQRAAINITPAIA